MVQLSNGVIVRDVALLILGSRNVLQFISMRQSGYLDVSKPHMSTSYVVLSRWRKRM